MTTHDAQTRKATTESTSEASSAPQGLHYAWRVQTFFGAITSLLFVAVYSAEFLPHTWPPAPLRWLLSVLGTPGAVLLNVAMMGGFVLLLPYRRESRSIWKSRSLFVAFALALMTEMLGWPLLVFLLSPHMSIGLVNPYYQALGHWPATVGMFMVFGGVALIVAGWRRVVRDDGLLTDGLYGRIQHPQYTGILLFTLGWVIDYPATLPLLMWPILAVAYIRLALAEEKFLAGEYGAAHVEYSKRTPRFIPSLFG